MNDELLIQNCYKEMYSAMIAKDRSALEEVLDDSFVLVHMTGMRQSKDEFINAVLDGTLNYYSAVHENMPVEIKGDTAVIIGQSYVQAAVFGGGKGIGICSRNAVLKRLMINGKLQEALLQHIKKG